MPDYSQRMVIIGAGPVGLATAKALKEGAVPYDQIECDDDVGGNWYHGVYRGVHIVSSRKTTEYADFPMPEDYPDFPSAQQMLDYLRDYTETFRLRENIIFDTKVLMARPAENDLWEVVLSNGESRHYKGLIVCNGHHWKRRLPSYPGTFTGEYIHSKDYRDPRDLAGKRVLVIGGGNSGCDIVCEGARVGASADLSLRRGYWFLPKTMGGRPTVELMRPWMPLWFQRTLLRVYLKMIVGDYAEYGLPKPDHKIFEAHPTINNELLHYLKHGRIGVRPDVKRLDGNHVEFVDGSREAYDIIVCATGFHISFPFLPEGLVPVEGAVARLIAGAVLPDYKHLYVLGTVQLRYGFGPLLTPYAEIVREMIRVQDKLDRPIGKVLRKLGQRVPETHLIDPFKALRDVRRAKRILPWLPAFEKIMMKKAPFIRNEPIVASVPGPEELKVF